jgi:hypothetical protein
MAWLGNLCKTPRGAESFGLGRPASLSSLPIASALALILALEPIPIRTLGIHDGFCRGFLVMLGRRDNSLHARIT